MSKRFNLTTFDRELNKLLLIDTLRYPAVAWILMVVLGAVGLHIGFWRSIVLLFVFDLLTLNALGSTTTQISKIRKDQLERNPSL